MLIFLLMVCLFGLSWYFDSTCKSYFRLFFLEKDLKIFATIIEGLDEKQFFEKRYKQLKSVLVFLLFWPILNFNTNYLILILLLSFVIYKAAYWKVKRQMKAIFDQVRFQFPIWLRQIQILLQNNTVVTALELSYDNAPILFRKQMKLMIDELIKDPQNLKAYTDFLSEFQVPEISRAMKLLHRYNVVGQEDSYRQFNRMIQTTSKWLRSERLRHKNDSLLVYQWWGMMPLFGMTFVFLAIMINIIGSLFGKGVRV